MRIQPVNIGSYSKKLSKWSVKLFCIPNCFFAMVLFNAGSLVAARGESGARHAGTPVDKASMETKKIGLVIHGGAGTIKRSKMTREREREHRSGVEGALAAGYEIVKGGGSRLDATEASVRVLED